MTLRTEWADRFRQAIENASWEDVQLLCEEIHPSTIAEILEDLPLETIMDLLEVLDAPVGGEIFGHLPIEVQHDIAVIMDPQDLAQMIVHMPADERADLVQRLDAQTAESFLRLVAQKERENILKLSNYQEGTAGSVMTSEYAVIGADISVTKAVEELRRAAPSSETISVAFVVDDKRRPVGYVKLSTLILANASTAVKDVMEKDIPIVSVDAPASEASKLLSQYDIEAIPVVNGGGAMAGIITFDDAMDVAEARATHDMHQFGGTGSLAGKAHMSASGAVLDLKTARFKDLIVLRAPWLLILVFMNIFSGAGIAYFEDTIAAAVALVFFLPLIIDSGGNAGSQSATLMVRALALGDVKMRDWFFLIRREVLIAGCLGLLMSLAVASIGLYRGGPEIALVVSLAMMCTVLTGSLVGMSLPFILQKLKMDPASASAPLITSIADICGVLIYFGIASTVLGL